MDIINIGKQLSTELMRVNLPPYDKCFAFEHDNLFSKRSSIWCHSLFRSCLWCIGIPRYLNGYSPALQQKSSIYSSWNSFALP
jgi:hypothetical protein